jgi:hypothetical protein
MYNICGIVFHAAIEMKKRTITQTKIVYSKQYILNKPKA